MFTLKWPFIKKKTTTVEVEILRDEINVAVPKGWVVFEAGQSMMHSLWFCQMIKFDSLPGIGSSKETLRVYAEEYNHLSEALEACVRQINAEDFIRTPND